MSDDDNEWTNERNLRRQFFKSNGHYLPDFALENLDQVKRFKYDESDIFIASYPKSGTTWTEEIVYSIVNDGDFALAKSKPLNERVPYLEFPVMGIDLIDQLADVRPRLIKTHLPLSFLPDGIENDCKV